MKLNAIKFTIIDTLITPLSNSCLSLSKIIKLQIEAYGEEVSTRLVEAKDPIATYVLAHGAGAGIDHDFMQKIQTAIAKQVVTNFSFNFIYKEKGKKLPGSKKILEQTYKEVWGYILGNLDGPYFAGGKSMGGRISTHVEKSLSQLSGLIFLGYPVHAPGRPEKFNSPQLYEIQKPMLFLQGSRDPFSKQEFTDSLIPQLPNAQLHWLEGGEHSWKTKKSNELTQDDLIDQGAKLIRKFCQDNI